MGPKSVILVSSIVADLRLLFSVRRRGKSCGLAELNHFLGSIAKIRRGMEGC